MKWYLMARMCKGHHKSMTTFITALKLRRNLLQPTNYSICYDCDLSFPCPPSYTCDLGADCSAYKMANTVYVINPPMIEARCVPFICSSLLLMCIKCIEPSHFTQHKNCNHIAQIYEIPLASFLLLPLTITNMHVCQRLVRFVKLNRFCFPSVPTPKKLGVYRSFIYVQL